MYLNGIIKYLINIKQHFVFLSILWDLQTSFNQILVTLQKDGC